MFEIITTIILIFVRFSDFLLSKLNQKNPSRIVLKDDISNSNKVSKNG
tara:strand:- start:165 stop:308 length:144 start_codon:yes stop_codon:yes gene_type:complete